MNKNWLIRTKNNHILGPVSKEKVKELISSGSIKGDDEVCSGNGYWVYVREQELIAKYIFGDAVQSFNPVQEAPAVLTVPSKETSEVEARSNELVLEGSEADGTLPSDDDLEYPDMGMGETDSNDEASVDSQSDITTVGVSIADIRNQMEAEPATEDELPPEPIQEEPSSKAQKPVKKKAPVPKKVEGDNVVPLKKKSNPKKKAVKKPEIKDVSEPKKKLNSGLAHKKRKNSNFLYIVIVMLFIVAVLALFFRTKIVQKLIESTSIIIPNAVAQDIGDNLKKKSGTHFPS